MPSLHTLLLLAHPKHPRTTSANAKLIRVIHIFTTFLLLFYSLAVVVVSQQQQQHVASPLPALFPQIVRNNSSNGGNKTASGAWTIADRVGVAGGGSGGLRGNWQHLISGHPFAAASSSPLPPSSVPPTTRATPAVAATATSGVPITQSPPPPATPPSTSAPATVAESGGTLRAGGGAEAANNNFFGGGRAFLLPNRNSLSSPPPAAVVISDENSNNNNNNALSATLAALSTLSSPSTTQTSSSSSTTTPRPNDAFSGEGSGMVEPSMPPMPVAIEPNAPIDQAASFSPPSPLQPPPPQPHQDVDVEASGGGAFVSPFNTVGVPAAPPPQPPLLLPPPSPNIGADASVVAAESSSPPSANNNNNNNLDAANSAIDADRHQHADDEGIGGGAWGSVEGNRTGGINVAAVATPSAAVAEPQPRQQQPAAGEEAKEEGGALALTLPCTIRNAELALPPSGVLALCGNRTAYRDVLAAHINSSREAIVVALHTFFDACGSAANGACKRGCAAAWRQWYDARNAQIDARLSRINAGLARQPSAREQFGKLLQLLNNTQLTLSETCVALLVLLNEADNETLEAFGFPPMAGRIREHVCPLLPIGGALFKSGVDNIGDTEWSNTTNEEGGSFGGRPWFLPGEHDGHECVDDVKFWSWRRFWAQQRHNTRWSDDGVLYDDGESNATTSTTTTPASAARRLLVAPNAVNGNGAAGVGAALPLPPTALPSPPPPTNIIGSPVGDAAAVQQPPSPPPLAAPPPPTNPLLVSPSSSVAAAEG